MLDGTWDWANYKVVLDYLQTWFDNGYLYEDCGTIKQADAIERCARNECAFIVGIGTSYQAAVVAQNPDVKMAMIPICASQKGGARFCLESVKALLSVSGKIRMKWMYVKHS